MPPEAALAEKTGSDVAKVESQKAPDSEDKEDADLEGEGEEQETEEARVEREKSEADAQALRDQIREEERQKLVAEQEQQQQEAAREARRQRVKDALPRTTTAIKTAVKGQRISVKDSEGNQIQAALGDLLGDSEIKSLILDHVDALHKDAWEAVSEELGEAYGNEALKVLPKAVHEEFLTAAAGKDVPTWLKAFGERYAEHSDWGKEQARTREAAVKGAQAEGVRIGQGLPKGEPSQEQSAGRPATREPANLDELTKRRARDQQNGGKYADDVVFLKKQDELLAAKKT